jgi:polyisoprenoid-binding protein YceI
VPYDVTPDSSIAKSLMAADALLANPLDCRLPRARAGNPVAFNVREQTASPTPISRSRGSAFGAGVVCEDERTRRHEVMFTTRITGIILLATAFVTAPSFGQEALRVSGGDITVICPLTVGGSFEAKTEELSGTLAVRPDTTAVDGALTVDLQTLETGIGLRDKHLKTNYLEVDKGPEFSRARLQDIRVDRLDGTTAFRGLLTLHGQTREVSGSAKIKRDGNKYRLEATFPVKVSDFQIPEPTYLGVGVADQVMVRVNLDAVPASMAAGTSGGTK